MTDAGQEKQCFSVWPELFSDDTVEASLTHLIRRYGTRKYHFLRDTGLYPGQMPVLGTLAKREGLSQRELADVLHIKPPTITVTVKRLERNGLVYKKVDEKDQRISRIYLTEAGRGLEQDIRHVMEENERILTSGFSEEEKEQVRTFLNRMTENLIRAELCNQEEDL